MSQQPSSPARQAKGTRGRAMLTTVTGAVTLALCIGAVAIPSSYVVEGPGPAVNTLGDDPNSKNPVISVKGAKTYDTESRLDLTTVSVAGGPGRSIAGVEALWAWADPHQDLMPREYVYPAGSTSEEEDQRNAVEMTDSQQSSIAAALTELDIDFTSRPVIAGFSIDANRGILKSGDVIASVDGKPVTHYEQVPDTIRASRAERIELGVIRKGKPVTLNAKISRIAQKNSGPQASLGIYIAPKYDFPFDVDFGLKDIGGPSAGSMMALGLIDKLTEGSLAGKHHVAGTGTITAEGKIGAIGGIPQKVVGARDSGATVFLAPQANCAELSGRVPKGLDVYSVKTLHDARGVLESLADGTRPPAADRCG